VAVNVVYFAKRSLPLKYLMDEPLSNLDAKLRVQMRAEISPWSCAR